MAARSKIPPATPLLITEYSVMVGEGMAASDKTGGGVIGDARDGEPPFQHDDPGAAAFVFRVVPQLSPHLEALSYWTFSDASPQARPKRAPSLSDDLNRTVCRADL